MYIQHSNGKPVPTWQSSPPLNKNFVPKHSTQQQKQDSYQQKKGYLLQDNDVIDSSSAM
jgi:hypothetical protein